MDNYVIKLGGIPNGEHTYSFEIKDQFFEVFTQSEVQHANIIATALLDKENNKLALTLTLSGVINNLLCDICAEDLSINIETKTKIIIKETDENLESTDEIIYVKTSENTFSLQHLIFEIINLTLPNKRQHPINEDGSSNCNKEMVDLIEKYTVKEEKSSDPRWDALKDLKLK